MSIMLGHEALLMGNARLVRFPPNPADHTVPKRVWEPAMADARGDVRKLLEADRWVSKLIEDPDSAQSPQQSDHQRHATPGH